jgi:hypothetical protein
MATKRYINQKMAMRHLGCASESEWNSLFQRGYIPAPMRDGRFKGLYDQSVILKARDLIRANSKSEHAHARY